MSTTMQPSNDQSQPAEPTRWTASVPELGTDPIPVESYVSPAYFERERETIFRRCWLNVGRVDQIPQAGDYFVHDLPVCDTSLLVVRGKDDVIRAFHNVCQHRGNHVVWQSRGHCRGAFTCRFHGWTYDTEGRLVSVPDEPNFFDLDKRHRGLNPVATDVWQGFIFVNLTDPPPQTLIDYLGDAGTALAGYPFEEMPVCYPYRPEIQVSWKVLVDAQQEGYHVPVLHRLSLAPSVAQLGGGVYRSHSFQTHGPHGRISTPANPGFAPNPTAALSAKFGPGSLDAFAGSSAAATTEADVLFGAFDLYVIFPNFFIGLLYGTYFTYNIWPLARRPHALGCAHVLPAAAQCG